MPYILSEYIFIIYSLPLMISQSLELNIEQLRVNLTEKQGGPTGTWV